MSTPHRRVGHRLAIAAIVSACIAAFVAVAAAPGAGASTPACGNASLAITHTPPQGATGHGGFVLLYRNITHATCTIHGYPGLDALDAHGHVLAHAQRTLHGFMGGASTVATIAVAPNHFASATVEWLNFNPSNGGSCRFSTSVATTPANTTHTVHFPVSVSVCRLQVHPTVGGTSGNDAFALAQQQWIGGASAISANQGAYWKHAEAYLKLAGGSFGVQIAELAQLISLPDANQSPTQNAEYHHDINALNAFFGTQGLYA